VKLVAQEVRDGVVSASSARATYGVVVNENTMEVDANATARLRGQDKSA
jgi:hypothetical protein